ncbi:putative nuclease HARBI1 [Mercenaria mercenaria]|uniref:putative nuclease HARBI1 n=1 Tax=Mercenaria mercenaria TaxID=6596 RepID=UPI00234F1A15|nr:putative nuclease HARBI1 [Mercenaria mercenaria]
MAAFIPNARRPRRFRRVNRQTDDLDNEELRRRYRFGSENLDRLEDLIGDRLRHGTNRNFSLTARQQILIALRFFASGCFLQLIGDTFGVDIATVSRTITRVTDVLFSLKDEYIRFPTTDDERRTVQQGFYKIRQFPGVVGCIDGTHVRIISPPKDQEAAYVNRKRYHFINVQATCNHRGMYTVVSHNGCLPSYQGFPMGF